MACVQVQRLVQIGLTVANLDAAAAFYQALGFHKIGEAALDETSTRDRFGLDSSRAMGVHLQLGAQRLELLAFDPPGTRYPLRRAANDPWFQHFAIVVADAASAYAVVLAQGRRPISTHGPQLLPPSTGSVTAYKFRDPEGHPLELSFIPGSAWVQSSRLAPALPFLGVDHSAIAVSNLEASLDFYVGRLGMRVDATLLNTGPEQDRLDGLDGVSLDILVLRAADPDGPHLELLHYRSPKPAEAVPPFLPNDIAATRLTMAVSVADGSPLNLAGFSFLNPPGSAGVLVRDPDGHLLELVLNAE